MKKNRGFSTKSYQSNMIVFVDIGEEDKYTFNIDFDQIERKSMLPSVRDIYEEHKEYITHQQASLIKKRLLSSVK